VNYANLIAYYYKQRELKWPDFSSAMKFVQTELGEVYELDLAREGGWIRNNPDTKPTFDKVELGKELGDVIMMLIVAGMVEGIDPMAALENKLQSKLSERGLPVYNDLL
jgi:hypothetical protein